jgi:hypothetical protein
MSTIGELRKKALSASKRKVKRIDLPEHKTHKAKTRPSLVWSVEKYRKGQEQK